MAASDSAAPCWAATAPTVSMRDASPRPRSSGLARTPAGSRSRTATAHWYAVAATSVPRGTTPSGPATGSRASRAASGEEAQSATSSRARCRDSISASRLPASCAAMTRPSIASSGSAVVMPSRASRRMSGRGRPSGQEPSTTRVRPAVRPDLRVGALGSTWAMAVSRSSQAPTVASSVPVRSALTRPRSPGAGRRLSGGSVTITSCRETVQGARSPWF